MKKRKFLIPVTAALAALVSPAEATMQAQEPISPNTKDIADAVPQTTLDGERVLYQVGNDLFSFVLGKTGHGEVLAQHSSHSSHSSHGSHRSHYSSS